MNRPSSPLGWLAGLTVAALIAAGCNSKPGAGEAPKQFTPQPKEPPSGGPAKKKPTPQSRGLDASQSQ